MFKLVLNHAIFMNGVIKMKSITDEIPYENEDTLQNKLDRISYLERMGRDGSLKEWEINDLDRLYMDVFGHHLSENLKKLYR